MRDAYIVYTKRTPICSFCGSFNDIGGVTIKNKNYTMGKLKLLYVGET